MYAKVVVDIRSDNLNESFDYAVPNDLVDYVFIGSRVKVSFGFKEVLGYVIEIKEKSDFTGNLKPIIEVLDYEKELTDEQIELAKYFSGALNVPLVVTLGLMLPALLKEKQRKYLYVKEYEKLHPELALVFNGKKKVLFDKSLLAKNALIKEEIKKQNLEIGYDTYAYGRNKYTKVYRANTNELQKSLVRNRILEYLNRNPDATANDIRLATNCSQEIIRTMVREKLLSIKNILILEKAKQDYQNSNKYKFNLDQEQLLGKYFEGGLKPYLLFTNDESFKMHFLINVIDYNIKNKQKTIIFTPSVMQAEAVNIYIRKHLPGLDIDTFHSKNSNSENYDTYTNIKHDNYQVLITTMGAFLPYNNVGSFIILDEDNPQYIYEYYPNYDIRKVIIKRGELLGAKVILESSAPSINTYYQAKMAKYYLLEYNLPHNNQVRIVDMKAEMIEANRNIISEALDQEIRLALKEKKITLLLVNNKSFSTLIKCRNCGEVMKCPHCRIPLVLIRSKGIIKCNYCEYKLDNFQKCSKCGSENIAHYGFGLEQVNRVVSMAYPQANIVQVDADNVKTLDDYTEVLTGIEEGNVDIIIGTNSLTNLPRHDNIKVVGLLYVDSYLHLNDYRGAEYTYNLITKMVKFNVCVIQTYYSNHYAIVNASTNNYERYYQEEINNREILDYEPFTEMNRIIVTGPYNKLFHFGYYYRKAIRRVIGDKGILGPSYDYRLQGVKLVLKHNNYPDVIKVLNDAIKNFPKDLQITYERNPKGM